MYPHFIEVHRGENKLSVNIDHIKLIGDHVVETDYIEKNQPLYVDENYDEIKNLIIQSGCHIQKADPRLSNKALTMEELKQMVGKPVWNSYLRCWQLVREYLDNVIFLTYNAGNCCGYNKEDLTRYPLYGMKEDYDEVLCNQN